MFVAGSRGSIQAGLVQGGNRAKPWPVRRLFPLNVVERAGGPGYSDSGSGPLSLGWGPPGGARGATRTRSA